MQMEIEKLRAQILEFNRQYEAGTPLVEDYIYDFYKKKLAILEADLQYKISDVIGTRPIGEKAKHLHRILSLSHDFGKSSFDNFLTRIEKKLHTHEKIEKNAKMEDGSNRAKNDLQSCSQPKTCESNQQHNLPYPLVAELKVDGVSVVVRYENGQLQRIATRGDGVYGEDITHLAKFLNLPNNIYIKQLVEIRFEAYIHKDKIKNPRNAVAGMLLKKEPDENLKYINFMPHNLYTQINNTNEKIIQNAHKHQTANQTKEGKESETITTTYQEDQQQTDSKHIEPSNGINDNQIISIKNISEAKLEDNEVVKDESAWQISGQYASYQTQANSALKHPETDIWPTYMDLRAIFEKMHLDILPYYKLCHTKKDMEQFFDEIDAIKDKLPFEIDGVVFKINNHSLYNALGETATAPRYAFAVKFENTFAISTIQDITFQVGRFGRLTPVAEIEETKIKGRKIKRATLNNFNALKEKNYTIGDIVKIEMAGEVIPMISDIIQKGDKELELPTTCPSCASYLNDDTCINDWNCQAQRKQRLAYFAGKHGLDITSMGEKQIEFFMQMGIIEYPYDFFEIKNRINMITCNPSWLGQKALSNLLEAIEKSKHISLEAFIVSLGMLHIGRAKATAIAHKFPDFNNFLISSVEDLQFLGPEIAKDVYIYKQQQWITKTFAYMKIGQEYKNEDIVSLF